jgi:hypothetical protein
MTSTATTKRVLCLVSLKAFKVTLCNPLRLPLVHINHPKTHVANEVYRKIN